MNIRIISQYAGDSAHFSEINSLLSQDTYSLFRLLVAYTSISGLKLLEDSLIQFLEKKGNFLDWIIGVEQGITTKEVLEYLEYLKSKYPNKVRVRIFTAGNDMDIFHLKVYWLGNSDGYTVIIGSSNLTDGGLLRNFEASTLLELSLKKEQDKKVINDLEILWKKFSTPLPPLTQENLIELNKKVIKLLDSASNLEERKKINEAINRLNHPFSSVNKHKQIQENIKRLHSEILKKRRSIRIKKYIAISKHPKVLIMDILQETRDTQVQIPIRVLKPFFDVSDTSKKNEIILSEVMNDTLIKMDIRPFISQKNDTHRLEISGIKGLLRPLIIRFERIAIQEYEYEIINRSSPNYDLLDKLLSEKGNRARDDARRWYIKY